MKSDLARRIERQDMREWDRQYRFLLGPIVKTPDCTCDWAELFTFGSATPIRELCRMDENCPDHG